MGKLLEELKNFLFTATPEQLEQAWKEVEQFKDVGPTITEYIENMKEIKEDYVSFEVAKLLNEKGFDISCLSTYDINNGKQYFHTSYIMCATRINAPTHQVAMAWLREKYGIFIAINNDDLDFNWQCYDLINRESTLDPKILSESYGGFKNYEDVVEAAIKYCLENLI